MPVVVGILGKALDYWSQWVNNRRIGQNIAGAYAFAAGAAQDVQQEAAACWWALARLMQQASNDAGAAAHTGAQFGAALAEVRLVIRHLVDTIIPNSVYHAVGHVFSEGITPLRIDMREVQSDIRNLFNDVGALQSWRHEKVDPLLGGLLTLFGWMGGSSSPQLFAGWDGKRAISAASFWLSDFDRLAGNLVGPLLSRRSTGASWFVSWLADGQHQGGLDDLLQVLIDSSPDRYRHVIDAGVTILESPYP